MKALLRRRLPTALAIAIVAALSIAGIATANRAIRDNTINTRDIRDNQVNTKDVRDGSLTTKDIHDNQVNTLDLRDGAIRGIDVHDGSLGLADIDPAVASQIGGGDLVDPRRHSKACCLSWAQGPVEIAETAASATDPIPTAGDGRAWREIVLDPGAYVIEATGEAQRTGGESPGVSSRLFLGGRPIADPGAYALYPAAPASQFPTPISQTVAIEVGDGPAASRTLTQRVASVGAPATFADSLLISVTVPR